MKFDRNNLMKLKKALLRLSEAQTEEGITLITDGEIEVGAEVFVDGDEGLTPAQEGTYSYNGAIITVEGGVITAITEKPAETEETPSEEETVEETQAEEETPAEEAVEETPAEEESTEETAEQVAEVAEEVAEEATEEVVDVDALKNRIAELEALVEDLKKKLEEPVADSVEEEMKKDQKPTKTEMNYSRFRQVLNEVSQNKKRR